MNEGNQEAKDYFSQRATIYYQKHYANPNNPDFYPALYLRHNYILDMLNPHIKKGESKALDIGCGSGVMSKDLLARGCEVWAVDISKDMLKTTRAMVGETEELHTSIQDIEQMDLPSDFFDVIVCAGVIEYLKSDEKALREIQRVLKSGGVACITAQNKASLPRAGVELAELLVPKSMRKKFFALEQHRTHRPGKLVKKLKEVGLNKQDRAFFHFYPLPIPVDKIFNRFSIAVGKKMEKLSKTRLGFLATGYIVKVKKN